MYYLSGLCFKNKVYYFDFCLKFKLNDKVLYFQLDYWLNGISLVKE